MAKINASSEISNCKPDLENNLISFIIPTFNRAAFLAFSIESVLKQSDEVLWELIIVDDGSTDKTRKVVEPYLKEGKVRYLFQNNQGVSVARNKGVELAKGEYIIFLDSDDTLFPNLIRNLFDIRFYNFDLICWDVVKVIDGKISIWKPRTLDKMYNGIKVSFLAGSICYKKSIFLKSGGYDPEMKFGENYELGLRISQIENLRIKYIPRSLLRYEINSDTRTSSSIENRLASSIYQFQKHKDKYEADRKAKAKMYYIVAYLYEKSLMNPAAIEFYKYSWFSNPWNLKPVLKILHLYLLK